MRIAVLGAGSFGTSLAIQLSAKGFDTVLWARNQAQADMMSKTKGNHKYLPGIELPEGLGITSNLSEAIKDSDIQVFAVPAQSFRELLTEVKNISDSLNIVDVAKGLEIKTLKRLSEVAAEVCTSAKYACLSGPSHAEEVARFLPTTVTVSSEDREFALKVQKIFMSENFRVYTNNDIIGAELGGALKNIIALGAGVCDGIGLGDNSKAALMTRGLAEMIRLGEAMGAKPETFSGLTGLGDLIVTCTSMHSRNRRCGILIGKGMNVDAAKEKVGMVVEGITTTKAAYELAKKYKVEMPITELMYKLIDGKVTAEESVGLLMGRKEKHE